MSTYCYCIFTSGRYDPELKWRSREEGCLVTATQPLHVVLGYSVTSEKLLCAPAPGVEEPLLKLNINTSLYPRLLMGQDRYQRSLNRYGILIRATSIFGARH